ncbi:MAG: hypothetical protein ROM54_07820 [Anaerobiospirillum sp.]|nr:hypothetical protein [Anaerobiospirillum sp.]
MAFVIKAFVNCADKAPNIGLIEKISYGLGDFSSQLLLTPVSMLFIYYATEYVDIGMDDVIRELKLRHLKDETAV